MLYTAPMQKKYEIESYYRTQVEMFRRWPEYVHAESPQDFLHKSGLESAVTAEQYARLYNNTLIPDKETASALGILADSQGLVSHAHFMELSEKRTAGNTGRNAADVLALSEDVREKILAGIPEETRQAILNHKEYGAGTIVQDALEELGLTPAELIQRIPQSGITTQTISDIVCGARIGLASDKIVTLANALQLSGENRAVFAAELATIPGRKERNATPKEPSSSDTPEPKSLQPLPTRSRLGSALEQHRLDHGLRLGEMQEKLGIGQQAYKTLLTKSRQTTNVTITKVATLLEIEPEQAKAWRKEPPEPVAPRAPTLSIEGRPATSPEHEPSR